MATVMCFGTFDVLHLGHINYFEQAKEFGNYLIVVIARDKTKFDQKKETIFDECERLDLVKQLKIVNETVLGYPNDHFKIIQEHCPDVLCLGYDQEVDEKNIQEKLTSLGLNIEIKRMKPYKQHEHKSSLIKEQILKSQ
jgi:FAD synthetase